MTTSSSGSSPSAWHCRRRRIRSTDTAALERIGESIEELDATIRDVRSTIFSLALAHHDRVGTSTRARLLDVTSMAAQGLGFQPRLQFDGPVDTKVPEELVPDVLAVVREGLSNTARHAKASRVEVRVDVHDDLTITVTDNGIGHERQHPIERSRQPAGPGRGARWVDDGGTRGQAGHAAALAGPAPDLSRRLLRLFGPLDRIRRHGGR